SGGAKTAAAGHPTIALLLPESKTARYETQDRPRFERRVRELCRACRVLYANANQEAAVQQSQAEAAFSNDAHVMVLDPVDPSTAAGCGSGRSTTRPTGARTGPNTRWNRRSRSWAGRAWPASMPPTTGRPAERWRP